VAAALGCAAGAMAARYTTGPRWAAVGARAEAIAQALDEAASACLRFGDADALAYAALTAARKSKDEAAIATASRSALGVPLELLAACARQAAALADFLPACNPQLASDVKVGIHLLAGAGRAAWQTLLVNQPDATQQGAAAAHLLALASAEHAAEAQP
jgi:formiminotetrahydrofolate cyclodeaminase